jgi:hypothetical protein
MSPLQEVTNNDKPVQKAVGKTKGKVGRPPKAVATPAAAAKVAVKDEEKNKAPNFHEDEDELVAMAWVSATENPIVGSGQKAAVFWGDVHSRYLLLQARSQSANVGNHRSWNQVKGRFLRHIQPNVSVFNRYYKRAKDTLPSGTPDIEEEIMKIAVEDFYQDNKKRFKFALCVPILHQIPKFCPIQQLADEEEAAGCAIGAVSGSTLDRPIGAKAAKELKKEAMVNQDQVKEMRKDFKSYVETSKKKAQFSELLKLAKYYRSIGESVMARAVDDDLKVFIAAQREERKKEKEEEERKKLNEATLLRTPSPSSTEVVVVATPNGTNPDLGCPERNRAFAPYDIRGIMLPPDDSDFEDTLLERIHQRDGGRVSDESPRSEATGEECDDE